MRWIALLACLAVAPALAHELPEQHTHGFFVPADPSQPPVEPPIEPPPVEPPPGNGSHFERACAKPGTGCNALRSMERDDETHNLGVWNADVEMTAVPNSPTNPERKGKCSFNGGDFFCAEYFQQGDCTQLPTRSNESLEASRGYSTCYDPAADAMRAQYWADRGSSIIHASVMRADFPVVVGDPPGEETPKTELWMQFEIKLSEGMFREPAGSVTAKLARLYHSKDLCRLPHVYSHRWGFHPTYIWFGWVSACEGNDIYPSLMADRPKVPREDAGKWVRVTAAMYADCSEPQCNDVGRNYILSVSRVDDGHVYGRWHQAMAPSTPQNLNVPSHLFITEWLLPMVHSTQHTAEPGCDKSRPGGADDCGPSPAFWLRHAVVSTAPIEY